MELKVHDDVKWDFPLNASGEEDEECQGGQCKGIVAKTDKFQPNNPKATVVVYWYKLCPKHREIDPDGIGPYEPEYLTKI